MKARQILDWQDGSEEEAFERAAETGARWIAVSDGTVCSIAELAPGMDADGALRDYAAGYDAGSAHDGSNIGVTWILAECRQGKWSFPVK